jgi:hypothetical protein
MNDDEKVRFGYLAALNQRISIAPNRKFELWDLEFQVFSQWGEDGILNFLTDQLELSKPNVLEIGTENFTQCNSLFLAHVKNSRVFAVDLDHALEDQIKKIDLIWRTHIKSEITKVSLENIQEVFDRGRLFLGEIDVFSLDIDGIDWWILDALDLDGVSIVVCEYNSLFGKFAPITVPYNENFFRTDAHYSNLYYGASLPAYIQLMESKNFSFVGTNRANNNAFFVSKKHKKIETLNYPNTEDLSPYVRWNVRETREKNGNLGLQSNRERENLIEDMEVVDLRTTEIKKLGDFI